MGVISVILGAGVLSASLPLLAQETWCSVGPAGGPTPTLRCPPPLPPPYRPPICLFAVRGVHSGGPAGGLTPTETSDDSGLRVTLWVIPDTYTLGVASKLSGVVSDIPGVVSDIPGVPSDLSGVPGYTCRVMQAGADTGGPWAA
eukprot:1188910-Prorocentrum_minimum.AAC.1